MNFSCLFAMVSEVKTRLGKMCFNIGTPNRKRLGGNDDSVYVYMFDRR